MRLVGHSPAALEGYLSLNGALNKGKLDAKLRERIALAVAEFNDCDCCLSAHAYLGRNVAKLSGEEIDAAREGPSSDTRAAAALRFALQVAEGHGCVCETDLAALRNANFDKGAVIEIVVTVALSVLTHYVNKVARTDIDLPKMTTKVPVGA
jgi:AhpD family alkylhydroperoxidase